MSKRVSQTNSDKKLQRYKDKYGEDYNLYCFEFKRNIGHIGCAPAPDLKTAFERVLHDHRTFGHKWMCEILEKLRRKKLLSKYVTVTKTTYDKPMTWVPLKGP